MIYLIRDFLLQSMQNKANEHQQTLYFLIDNWGHAFISSSNQKPLHSVLQYLCIITESFLSLLQSEAGTPAYSSLTRRALPHILFFSPICFYVTFFKMNVL